MKSNYSHSEKLFANILSRFPVFKKLMKAFYARIMYLLHKKNKKSICQFDLREVAKEDAETFFGYYDKSPISSSGKCLVNVSKNKTAKLPDANSPICIKVIDGNNLTDIEVSTSAYNWQQGARAQWLNEDVFLYNDFDKETKKYIAKAYSVKQKAEIKRFDHPVQDSFKDEYFLSVNYQRIFALQPEYGYRCLPALHTIELHDIRDDGIWHVEFKNGGCKLLYSIEQICAMHNEPIFSKTLHEINHVMISPDGSKCIFIHRYYLGKRRFDRLFLANIYESRLSILAENEMVSHCFWIDEKTVIGYLCGSEKKYAYWLIDIDSGRMSRLPNNALAEYGDGHPHVAPKSVGDLFVTDTYPDKARMQHLLLCNWKTGEVKELGQFFHGFKFSGETRCDLHPRFSYDGKSIFFDSVFSGERKLYKMDLNV
jgi:WD40 repeat protein